MKGTRPVTPRAAETDPHHADPRLRGRTYAIPFDAVWSAAVDLAGGVLRGWRIVEADDQDGVNLAEAVTLVFRWVDDVRVDVALDENAQTRVDVRATPRGGSIDLERKRRIIRRFLRKLDRRLGATAAQILDPTRVPDWS